MTKPEVIQHQFNIENLPKRLFVFAGLISTLNFLRELQSGQDQTLIVLYAITVLSCLGMARRESSHSKREPSTHTSSGGDGVIDLQKGKDGMWR
mgnify:CR=1 FL=1